MYLSRFQSDVLARVMTTLAEPHEEREIRIRVGELMLDLLGAQHYASYVWDDTQQCFDRGVQLNMDPANLAVSDPSKMDFGGASAKAWKDIWGCGQGIGAVTQVQSTAAYVAQLKREYAEAKAKLLA